MIETRFMTQALAEARAAEARAEPISSAIFFQCSALAFAEAISALASRFLFRA